MDCLFTDSSEKGIKVTTKQKKICSHILNLKNRHSLPLHK